MPEVPPTQTHLEIKDWRTHQHYGKRRPPWIKLYTRLLDDVSFMAMPEAAQAQLVKIWILAASMGHPLPNDPRLLVGKIGNPKRLYLPELIAAGFVIPCYQDASNVLAKDEQNARPLSTENREQRTETPPSVPAWQPIAEQRLAERLPTDAGRRALTVILSMPEVSKAGVVSALMAILEGMHGTATPEQLEAALIEYAAGGMTQGKWSSRHFGGFLRTAKQPSRPEPAPAVTVADGGQYVAKIRSLIKQIPGRGKYLPKNEVEALGPQVLVAYESVGGADRFIGLDTKDLPFLIRDFNNALRGAA